MPAYSSRGPSAQWQHAPCVDGVPLADQLQEAAQQLVQHLGVLARKLCDAHPGAHSCRRRALSAHAGGSREASMMRPVAEADPYPLVWPVSSCSSCRCMAPTHVPSVCASACAVGICGRGVAGRQPLQDSAWCSAHRAMWGRQAPQGRTDHGAAQGLLRPAQLGYGQAGHGAVLLQGNLAHCLVVWGHASLQGHLRRRLGGPAASSPCRPQVPRQGKQG